MEPTRPDYAYWDSVDPVEIQHAAWLWCDLEPPPGAFQKGGEATWPGKVLAAEGMLLRECRQVPAALARGHHLRHMSEPTAPRSQLRDLAIQLGVAPPFLFPEVRDPPAPSPVEKPLHESERATLLKIISALAELQGIRPGKGAYRSEAAQLLSKMATKGIEPPCTEKTLSNHLKAALDSR